MKLWSFLTTVATALALGLVAQGATAPNGNSVVGSKHDLSALGAAGAAATSNLYGQSQVCIPCHAPHGIPEENHELSRLWNHTLNPASFYKLEGGIPVAANGSTTTTIDETSRKCLGCHDGTIALDSYGSHNGTLGTINPGYVIGEGGNLEHDHPIDVLYNGSSSYSVIAVKDKSGNAPGTANWTPTWGTQWSTTARSNDPSTFSITGYTSSKWGPKTYTQTALSALSFYKSSDLQTTVTGNVTVGSTTYNGVTATTSSLYVNCRTCHDPHNNLYNFLRVPNDHSQMCLTCHNK